MRKIYFYGALLASTVLAGTALARDDSWYIEADGGVAFVDDLPMYIQGAPSGLPSGNPSGSPTGTEVLRMGTKTGYDFGGIVGYDFGMLRLEGEASYRRAPADAFSNMGVDLLTSGSTFSGSASSLSFMANGLVDIGKDDGLQVFAGGGVGYARTKLNLAYAITGGTDINIDIDDDDGGFAWQLLAGVRYPLSERIDIGLKYRYFNQNNVDFMVSETISGEGSYTIQAPMRTRFRSHSALLTLAYNFGAPAPAPVPAPAPTPVVPTAPHTLPPTPLPSKPGACVR